MIIEYSVDENDFLTHQLFVASKSDRIKRKRKRSKVIVPILYVTFGLLLFLDEMLLLGIVFFIIGFLWFFLYPIWEKNYYIKHYRSFIKENYKVNAGKSVSLEINNNFILAKDNASESKVLTKEIEKINEISSTIFVRLSGGQSFILPKDKIANIENVKTALKELATFLNIKYDIEEEWEWK